MATLKRSKDKKIKESKTTKTQSQSKKETSKTSKIDKKVTKKSQHPVKKEENKQTNGNGDKKTIIGSYAVKPGDTGSPEVQIALLSNRIDRLTSHLGENKKDNHSRRGLLGLISKRRRLLIYLQEKDTTRYQSLIKKIGLKK